MFGTYRTILALMVVAAHVGATPGIGAFALTGFYILSGYLMTFILREKYDLLQHGIYKYVLNRFLRIYPMYWAAIGISVIFICWAGEDFSSQFHVFLYLPDNFTAVLKNVFIFLGSHDSPRLVPASWALTVELFFYLLIGFGFSKTWRLTFCWFLFSMAYHPIAFYFGWDHYFTIFAASLSFSMGALIYHYKNEISRLKIKINNPIAILFLLFMNWLLGILLGSRVAEGFFWSFFYINHLTCSIMVVTLKDRPLFAQLTKASDKWIGDLSYPIYLLHVPVGMVVSAVLKRIGFDDLGHGLVLLLISFPFILLGSAAMAKYIGRPIDRFRGIG